MSNRAYGWIWTHEGLTARQKLVLLAMANHDWGDKLQVWPSVPTLSKMTGLHKRTVQRVYSELVAAGIVIREVNAGGTDAYRADRRPNLFTIVPPTGVSARGGTVPPRQEGNNGVAHSPNGVAHSPNGVAHSRSRGGAVPPKQRKEQINERRIERRTERNEQNKSNASKSGDRLRASEEKRGEGNGAMTAPLSPTNPHAPQRDYKSEAEAFVRMHADKGEARFWLLLRAQRDYNDELRGAVFSLYAPIRRREAKRRAALRHGETPGVCVNAAVKEAAA